MIFHSLPKEFKVQYLANYLSKKQLHTKYTVEILSTHALNLPKVILNIPTKLIFSPY